MTRRRREPYGQRRLVLELRYAIDVAKRQPTEANIARVRSLVEDHPHGVGAGHVRYNLGEQRAYWLYENGLLPKPNYGGKA